MHKESLQQIQKEWHGSYKAYAIGFALSLLLTLIAFAIVITKATSPQLQSYIVVALAFTQAIVQSFFFLHVGRSSYPYWEDIAFGFMLLVLVIITGGSLWIMFDLNNRVMGTMGGM